MNNKTIDVLYCGECPLLLDKKEDGSGTCKITQENVFSGDSCELYFLQKEYNDLLHKMNHLKMIHYGNGYRFEQELKKYFMANEIVKFEHIIQILNNEIELSDNLCLMCDGVNKYVKFENALNQIINQKYLLNEASIGKDFTDWKGEFRKLLEIAENGLDIINAEQAVNKVIDEFKQYQN